MPATPATPASRLWPPLLLPVLAFCVLLPLIIHGPSCGHDFEFHLQSWMDAAAQIRHGHLLPHWAFSPAYNAGEPRFIFYPPLSWLLGSLLLLSLPAAAVPAAYTWICLAAAGLTMYSLARRYTLPTCALLASAVYIANPYLLFTAFERTAFAELLAAAWMPLLFAAALAPQLSAVSIALPLALLWLTNAPAAVMGTYALVLIVLVRACLATASRSLQTRRNLVSLLLPSAAGLVLGLALPAFYLVPAAWQRRYVQIAMAIIPNMRVEDNFLFGRTGYGPHDAVLHTASLVAVQGLGLTLLALGVSFVRTRRPAQPPSQTRARASILPILAALLLVITLMLCSFTLPLWRHLPELAFLQFPWRLLSLLGCVLGVAIALALGRARIPAPAAIAIACGLTLAAAFTAIRPFRQGCDANDSLPARLALFQTHHGVGPTDEYTPTDADNDQLRWDDPAWWLATNPNAPGPNTVPNPAATILDYDQPPPWNQTLSGQPPMHLSLHLQQPQDLILNLRDYPAWRVSVNGQPDDQHLQRDDGLLALALPAGDDTVDIRWHTLPDMRFGDAVSLAAVLAAAWLRRRSRRIEA